VLLFIAGMMPLLMAAQSPNYQFWTEYMVNYPFANSYNIENAFVYSTVIGSPRWRSVDYSPTLEYALTQHVDLNVGGTIAYTAQTESYNTFELRPMLGARFHFTPNKRLLVRTYLRLEQRNFLNLETDTWNQVLRPRARFETIFPINRKRYYEDKLVYAIADAEFLFTHEDVEERFANRFRLRMGVGHRINYSSRLEFLYMIQESRNGIDEDYETSDHVFRFRYKHYLRKKKPTTLSGSN
jgi:hypothetical protein